MIKIEELLKNLLKHEEQGYALYYYEKGNVIEKCQGYCFDDKNLITFDSNFRLASVSKQFIAFAIVRLINQGKLKYDTNEEK